MVRTFVLIGLLAMMAYCAVAAPARAQEGGESAVIAARADWRSQRMLLPGWLVARGASRALAVAARVTAAQPHALCVTIGPMTFCTS